MMRPDDDSMPPEIQAALKALYQPARGMENDAAVLRAARAAGAARAWPWRRWAAVGVAAAMAVIVGALWMLPRQAAYARTGDIRDAYYLARTLKTHANGRLDPSWDVNSDGIIDERDVRALAQSAVRLDSAKTLAFAPPDMSGKGTAP